MNKIVKVLQSLLPEGGFAVYGDSYEDIVFIEAKPITKAAFQKAFDCYDSDVVAAAAKVAADRATILAKIGITADEAKLLLS
jgi:hypothetical protein